MSDSSETTAADERGDSAICPTCHAAIPVDAPACPKCGHFILRGDQPDSVWTPRRGRLGKALAIGILAFVGLTIAAAIISLISGAR